MGKTGTKNMIWTLAGNEAKIVAPSGKSLVLDLSKLISSERITPFEYYGIKQWLSDDNSDMKGDEKLNGIKLSYDDAIKSGVELTENGRVHIIGSTKAKSDAFMSTCQKVMESNSSDNIKKATIAGLELAFGRKYEVA